MTSVCNKCQKHLDYHCQCDVHSVKDIAIKVCASLAGVGLVFSSYKLDIISNNFLVHSQNAMRGAGMCTAYQGVLKTVTKKKYGSVVLCADMTFGAVTNVLTCGITIAADMYIINNDQCSSQIATNFNTKNCAIQILIGAVGGIVTKIINEFRECSMREKKWSCFGKSIDHNGEENGTVTSWIVNTIIGSLYGFGAVIFPIASERSHQLLSKCKSWQYRWNKRNVS